MSWDLQENTLEQVIKTFFMKITVYDLPMEGSDLVSLDSVFTNNDRKNRCSF